MKKIKNYIKEFYNGERNKAEYITAIVISCIMFIITIVVMPILIMSKVVINFNIWLAMIIILFAVFCLLFSGSCLMLKAKKKVDISKERVKRILSSEWKLFVYNASEEDLLIKTIIRNSNLKIYARLENEFIGIKVVTPDGGTCYYEVTNNYNWFISNFHEPRDPNFYY